MSVIYEPRGMAREYAPLALNVYSGCTHGCRYCYAPSCLQRTREDFHAADTPRKDIVRHVKREVQQYAGGSDRILLSFTCDPYQPSDAEHGATREVLKALTDAGAPWQVLTKGGTRACRDFDVFLAGGGLFATSLVFTDDSDRAEWEPNAAPVADRLEAIAAAHALGIPTWVSIEPVIDPAQALEIIERYSGIVDAWKVGKLNHHAHAATVDWQAFADALYPALQASGRPYLVKDSLHRYLPKDAVLNTICEAELAANTRSTTATLF